MDTITFITALAAFLTAVASFFMVIEMRSQRKATNKPILKIASALFKAEIKNQRNAKTPKNWHWDWEFKNPSLTLYNFGEASAMNVRIEFVVDYKKICDSFKKVSPNLETKNGRLLILAGENLLKIESVSTAKQFIDAIQTQEKDTNKTIEIPSPFVDYFQHYWYYADKIKGKHILGPCFINLEYENINGKLLKQKFELLIRMDGGIEHPSEGRSEMGFLYQINEIRGDL